MGSHDKRNGELALQYVVCAVGLVSTIASMVAIRVTMKPEPENSDNEQAFVCPAVPFIPGFAILVNFVLMATMSWMDHVYTAMLMAIFVGVYIAYRALSFEAAPSKVSEGSKV